MKTVQNTFFTIVIGLLATLALPASAADKVFSFYATIYNGGVANGVLSSSSTTPSVVLLDTFNRTPTQFNSVMKSVRDTLPANVSWSIITDKTVNGATSSCGTTPPAVPSSVTYSSGPITRDGLQGVKPSGHYCLWVAAYESGPPATSCVLEQWSGQANTGQNFGGGTPFTDFANQASVFSYAFTGSSACTGVLGCDATNNKSGVLDPTLDLAYADPAYQGKYGLIRGNNKDAGACIVVPYQFTLDITSVPQRAKFIVPPGTGQAVSAQYVIVWGATNVVPPEYPTASTDPNVGWLVNRPKVSWGTPAPPVIGTNDYVPALACVTDPADFSLVPSSDLAAVLPVIPNSPPFNTPALAGYPQYQPGQLAKMCVSQYGWTSLGRDSSGNIILQQWMKFIDQADGFVSRDF